MLHNHFPLNRCISDKKNLLSNLTKYYESKNMKVFDYLPESYELNSLNHPILIKIQESQQEK